MQVGKTEDGVILGFRVSQRSSRSPKQAFADMEGWDDRPQKLADVEIVANPRINLDLRFVASDGSSSAASLDQHKPRAFERLGGTIKSPGPYSDAASAMTLVSRFVRQS